MNRYRRLQRLLSTCSYRKFIRHRPLCCSASHLNAEPNSSSSSSSSILDPDKYQGLEQHGYSISNITSLPEYSALAVQLVHNKSGAEHLHIARDDNENAFSVAFRTVPLDSTGVPHILEHTVLCGSKRYPVRDPFFKMLNRTLSTFMNAFTASDWTMYPFATQNPKDFQNLMSIYLDAAFFPNLKESDFQQEGWRLEHSDLQNPDSEIIFKGVVFNEMKGALSNNEQLYASVHQNLLLPCHTYGYESGGDPLHIPNLTWGQLKHFHACAYHPSNALFFTYGNFPLADSLKQINDNVLQHFDKIDLGIHIPVEPKWEKSKSSSVTCPPDSLAPNPAKQNTCSVSYLLDTITTPFEAFTLHILSTLLVSGPNSPFFQSLIEPNIGSGYSPIVGVVLDTQNPYFAVGLQGTHPDDKEKILGIINETIRKVHQEGFEEERIESIIHTYELAKKHQTTNFGIDMGIGLASLWSHGKNTVEYIEIDQQVALFRKTMEENPNYLKDKVKELLMENPHKLILEMTPDDDYNVKKEEAEKKMLAEKLALLTEQDKSELLQEGLKLEEKQNEVEDISCLPKMLVTDIGREITRTRVSKHLEDGNVTVFTTEQPTNGITYFKAVCTTSSLPYVLKPYLPLFCKVLTRLGAGSRNHKELAQRIEMTTGGLNAATHLIPHHTDDSQFELGISFSSHCLKKNIPRMFSLWQDVFNEPCLTERDYLRTLIKTIANDMAMSVASSGHVYAMATASKSMNLYARIAELFGGLSQVEFMKELAEKEDLDETIEKLMKIAMYMLNANEMRCMLNTTKDQMDESILGVEGMLSSLETVGFWDEDYIEGESFQPKSKDTFVPMDFPINYVSKTLPGIAYTHEDNPSLVILAKLIWAKFLHREIREKGGAYGSGARHEGGLFTFFSYRDPNVTSTLDAFDGAIDWISEGKFTDEDIEEAKVSVFSSVDSPVAPGSRGGNQFFMGLSDEMRQQSRDRLFSASRADLIRVCDKYLVNNGQAQSRAVIGPYNEEVVKHGQWEVPFNYKV